MKTLEKALRGVVREKDVFSWCPCHWEGCLGQVSFFIFLKLFWSVRKEDKTRVWFFCC